MEEESPFGLEELFFSRTDRAGLILASNPVFQRVSDYSWEELAGRPHKIIRHPDTPRAVFWLLWDRLRKQEPIGAYVKNRARDGRIYWVYALASPVEDGYVSVRFKPSSPLFDTVRDLYRRCCDGEREDRLAPEESARRLESELGALGFRGYEAFMAHAMCEETRARTSGLGEGSDELLELYDRLTAAAGRLLDRAEAIVAACALNDLMPLNLQIQAAQLGPDGVALATIARNYGGITEHLVEQVNRFHQAAADVHRSVDEGLFLYCAAQIQREMADFFDGELADDSAPAEAPRLRRQEEAWRDRAMAAPAAISAQARTFREASAEMARLAATLEVTRVLGKVECAHLADQGGLLALLDELADLQKSIASGLRRLTEHNRVIEREAGRLVARIAE